MEMQDAKKAIKVAGIVGYLSAVLTAIVLFVAMAAPDDWEYKTLGDPYLLLDTVIIILLATGVLFRSRACALLLLIHFVVSKIAMFSDLGFEARNLVIAIVIIVIYARAVMGTFVYHRIRREEDPEYRSWRWWMVLLGGPVVGILLLMMIIGMLSTTSVVLPVGVVNGQDLSASNIKKLEDHGIVEPGETIDLFYSTAFSSILEEGNLLTPHRVVSYETYEGQLHVYSVPYDEVLGLRVILKGGVIDDTVLELSCEEFEAIRMPLSTENQGDEKFISEIESRTGKKCMDPEPYMLRVVDASEMSAENIEDLRALGALRDGEYVDMFYSESWEGISGAGNLLTDKRVVAYDHSGENGAMMLSELELDDIARVNVVREGQGIADMVVEIRSKTGDWFYIWLSVRDGGHEKFLRKLLDRTGLELYEKPEYARRVVDGNVLSAADLAFLHEKGVLQEGERVVMFYSADLMVEGCMLTGNRVISYENWDDEFSVYSTDLDKIKAVWDWSSDRMADQNYTYEVFDEGKESFYISLPPGDSGREVFLEMLLSQTGGELVEAKPLMTEVQNGSAVGQNGLSLLRSEGVLEDGEKVEWFYSSAYRSILDEGNLLTDRRVVSYEKFFQEEDVSIYAVEYEKVMALWDRNDKASDEGQIYIEVFYSGESGGSFYLVLPEQGAGTKAFVGMLQQRTGETLMRPEPCMVQVVKGPDLPDQKLMALRTRGVLKPRERLDMFYSSGVKSFLESGYALTENRVLSYADNGRDTEVVSFDFSQITSLQARVNYETAHAIELDIKAGRDDMQILLPLGVSGSDEMIAQIEKQTNLECEWEELE